MAPIVVADVAQVSLASCTSRRRLHSTLRAGALASTHPAPAGLSASLSAPGPELRRHSRGRGHVYLRAEGESGAAPPALGVYEAPPELLSEGLRRHTISVFVADETGMINRVAGVFARRGYNIESLAVGLNIDRALFTIVVIGTDDKVSQLIKQIYKLPNVIKVEDLTYVSSVERGLMLMKIAAEPGVRREILDLAKIFRAAVVDVSEKSMMLSVTGDPGKTRAFQRAMSKFGVVAVARTGKLALRREQAYNEGRRVQLAAAQRAREESALDRAAAMRRSGEAEGDAGQEESSEGTAPVLGGGDGGDVYKLEASDLTGVWDYAVLNPYWSDDAGVKKTKRGAYKPHTVSLLVDNQPGVLDRITGVIARRGYNVQSLGVGPAERPEVSRITLVVPGTDAEVAKLLTQLLKVISVLEAQDITHIPFVERELMLVKVACDKGGRGELMDLAGIFRAKVSDISGDTVTIEVTGDLEKLAQLQELLEPFGILEVARTGRVALTRDSGVNTALLEELKDDNFFA